MRVTRNESYDPIYRSKCHRGGYPFRSCPCLFAVACPRPHTVLVTPQIEKLWSLCCWRHQFVRIPCQSEESIESFQIGENLFGFAWWWTQSSFFYAEVFQASPASLAAVPTYLPTRIPIFIFPSAVWDYYGDKCEYEDTVSCRPPFFLPSSAIQQQ